jgi:hypothetical protein
MQPLLTKIINKWFIFFCIQIKIGYKGLYSIEGLLDSLDFATKTLFKPWKWVSCI